MATEQTADATICKPGVAGSVKVQWGSSAGVLVGCAATGWSAEVVDGRVVTELVTDAWMTVQQRYAGVAQRSLEEATPRHPGGQVSIKGRHAEPSRAVRGPRPR
ncbi:MAG: hypothetical protein ABIU87_10635 [Ornithinibacter sp.]